jgi:alpha-L-rhamnosidase
MNSGKVFSAGAKWIGSGDIQVSWRAKVMPAPFLRREYDNAGAGCAGYIRFCGLGYGELYVNGEKVTAELETAPSAYEKRFYYREYPVTLKPGKNVFGVVLGNGWYNCHTNEAWHFDKAPWRDNPKMIFELFSASGESLLVSDRSWQITADGPIIFDGLRNGEVYDARRELTGWLEPDYQPGGSWRPAVIVPGPGGVPEKDFAEPVKVVEEIPLTGQLYPTVWNVGRNITGRVRIKVRGEKGSKIRIRYSDRLAKDGTFTFVDLSHFVQNSEFQTEYYITASDREVECWHSRFCYHGFQYVEIMPINSNAEVLEVTAEVMRSGFDRIGKFESSSGMLNQVYACTVNSYCGNFVGIPSDCPHREKNGWTADALFAAESGLFTFDTGKVYHRWLQNIADVQRANGQLPGIILTGGWGFNYGSGPIWDAAFIHIPYYLWLYTGSDAAIRQFFDAMCRHLDYLGTLSDDGIIRFGLGDHCHPFPERAVPNEFILTCFYRAEALRLAQYAAMLGRDQSGFMEIADRTEKLIIDNWGDLEQPTALGAFAYWKFGRTDAVDKLNEFFTANGGKVEFGIVGGKFIPRVLADHGYADTAYNILTQTEFPGFGNWVKRGATTLWEYWDGAFSRNHIMFGDISAWMYEFMGGIKPLESAPGFRKFIYAPQIPASMDNFEMSFKTANGVIRSSWKRSSNGDVELELAVPENSEAEVRLEGYCGVYAPGKYTFAVKA